jgi:hypothetical protein
MTFNVSKCGAIVKTAESPILRLAGEVIPVVGEYTYLGFKVNTRGIDFGAQVSGQVESANAFLDFVKPRSSGWSHHTRKAIYSTFLRLKLEYGAPLVQAHIINPSPTPSSGLTKESRTKQCDGSSIVHPSKPR